MSRYTILLLLNLPFIVLTILTIVTNYKLKRASKLRTIFQVLFWVVVLIGLIMAETVYNWLFINKLTQTDSLSLFDVIQITAIVIITNITIRCRSRCELLEKRINDMHSELSIRLSN